MLPACCLCSPDDPPAKQLYAAYNAAGERKGLNFAGGTCPLWEDLPQDARDKWEAVARIIVHVSPVRDALARALTYVPATEVVFRDWFGGQPITAEDALRMIDAKDPRIDRFIDTVHGTALNMVGACARRGQDGPRSG